MCTYPELATFVFLSSVSVKFIGLLFEQHTYVDLQREMFSKTLPTFLWSEVRTHRTADDLGPFERTVGTRFTGGRTLAVQLIVGVPFCLASDKQTMEYDWWVPNSLATDPNRTWNMIGRVPLNVLNDRI